MDPNAVNLQVVGSLFVEVNIPGEWGESGYHGVIEIAIMEDSAGNIYPGGLRDANTHRQPEHVPPVDQVKEAMETAKWCYLNKAVFEGKVSNVSLAEWPKDQN